MIATLPIPRTVENAAPQSGEDLDLSSSNRTPPQAGRIGRGVKSLELGS
jgi:hypothetical protein